MGLASCSHELVTFRNPASGIIQNAVEASSAPGHQPIRIRIETKLAHADTQVVIAFRDWGSGISEASMPHVGVPIWSTRPHHAKSSNARSVTFTLRVLGLLRAARLSSFPL